MITRKSRAVWNGSLKDGKGSMEIGAGKVKLDYSFSSRFENGAGTNPEELIAAAHAGCFSMALSSVLVKAGFAPESITTSAQVSMDTAGDGFAIKAIKLITEAKVPKITNDEFQRHALTAKTNCPVSVALSCVPSIELEAKLLQGANIA
jgi:osmotically inducible protein OsmC